MPARFEVYADKSGAYRWRLKAANGVLVASSGESFSSKAAAIAGAEATKRASAEAAIEESEGSDESGTAVRVRLITNPARANEAGALFVEIRKLAETAIDSGKLNRAGRALLEDELLPLLDQLELLFEGEFEPIGEVATAKSNAQRMLGRLEQVGRDTKHVLAESAKLTKDVGTVYLLADKLLEQVPTIGTWIT